MKIGLLAGSGDLPVKVIQYCQEKGISFHIIAFTGQTDNVLTTSHDHSWHCLGTIGAIVKTLKSHQVTHLVMAGNIRRPAWSELHLDWMGTRWIAKLGLKALGDDSLLTGIINLLKQEGFQVLSAQDLLQDLYASYGVLGTHVPTSLDWQDIRHGSTLLKALAPLDIGQSIIIQQGLVLGVEAIEGTAALIHRVGLLKREGPGGVLVKMAKPQQSRLVDMPTIGPETILQMVEAGLKGIAVETNATQIIDKRKTLTWADAHGIFIVGIHYDES